MPRVSGYVDANKEKHAVSLTNWKHKLEIWFEFLQKLHESADCHLRQTIPMACTSSA